MISQRVRHIVGLLVLVVGAVVLPAPAGAGGDAAVVRVGYDLETVFTNLDPSKSLNTCDKNIWTLLYDSVVREGPGSLEPGLADSWEIAADGSSVTLHFPPGRTYHDGSPLTADSVRQGLEYNADNVGLSSVFARIAGRGCERAYDALTSRGQDAVP